MLCPYCSQEDTGYISSEICSVTLLQIEEEYHSVLHQEVLDYLNLTVE